MYKNVIYQLYINRLQTTKIHKIITTENPNNI